MPPDGTLQVGTQVNLGGLRAGFAEAEAAVKQASANMAAAQAQFGSAAERGNAQAAAALKLYQTELQSAQSALNGFAATEERETQVLRSNISARMAASAELRVLEGNLMGSTRAAAAFISTIPGVGAALQVAFPLFGALALIEVLVTMGEKIAKLADDFDGLRKISDEAFKEMAKSEQELITLTEEHARITRGLQVAQAELASGRAGRSAAGAAAGDAFDVSVATNNLKILEGQIKATQATYDDLLERSKETKTELTPLGGVFGGPAGGVTTAPTEEAKTAATQLGKVYTDLAVQQQQAENLRGVIAEKQTEMTLRQKEGQEDLGRASEEAARKWQTLLSQVQKSSEEVARTTREISNQQIEYWSRLKQESDLANDPSSIQLISKESRDQLEVLKQQTEQYRLQADAKIKAASETYRGVEQRTQTQVQTGALSPLSRISILQQAAAQEYAAQLDAIQKKEALDAGYLQKYQEDINQEAAISQAYYQKQAQLARQAQQQIAQPWVQAASQVENAWIGAFNKILVGGQQSWHALRDAGQQMTLALIDDAERWLLKKLETYAIDKIEAIISARTTQTSIAASNVATAESYAAVAATAAAASVAGIPLVGPGLAVAAASAMEASLQGFAAMAAFDRGTSYIPRDGMAMLHKGEAVLPPPQTQALLSALSGSGSQSGQAKPGIRDINFTANYHQAGARSNLSRRDFYNLLRRSNLVT